MNKTISNDKLVVDRLVDDISEKSSAFSLNYVDLGLDCTNTRMHHILQKNTRFILII